MIVDLTKEELERISMCLEADEQEILDSNLDFAYVYLDNNERRNATEEDRQQWLETSQSAMSKIQDALRSAN